RRACVCGAAPAPPKKARLFWAMPLVSGLALRTYWARPHERHSPKVERQPLRRGIAAAAKPTPAAKPKRGCPMTFEAKRDKAPNQYGPGRLNTRRNQIPNESEKSKWIGVYS